MDKIFILDTNLFFNMQTGICISEKTEDTIIKLTEKIIQKSEKYSFYLSPRIVEEILSFFEDKEQKFLHDFFSACIIKSPKIADIRIQADVFYKIIDDIRLRNLRGMDIAEDEIRRAGNLFMGKEDVNKKIFEMTVGPSIKNFRERYRNATRFGFIDSLADLDIIMLAMELDGTIVSSDEGLILWARSFGVKEILPKTFGSFMMSS